MATTVTNQDFTEQCFVATNVAQTDMDNLESNLHVLKSTFAGSSAPPNIVEGMLWYDTANDILKIYHSGAWVSLYDVGNAVLVGTIGTANLDPLCVTTAKIAALNVTEDKLATSSVTAAKIGSGAVTASKLENYAVGEYILGEVFTSGVLDYTANTHVFTWKIDRSGAIYVRVGVKSYGITGYVSAYRNSTLIGSHSTATSAWSYSTLNTAVTPGDLIKINAYTTNSFYDHYVSGKIMVNNPTGAGVHYSFKE